MEGEMQQKSRVDMETLVRVVEALIGYSVETRCIVKALMCCTGENGLLPPTLEQFLVQVDQAEEGSFHEWAVQLAQHDVPVKVAPPPNGAISLDRFIKADRECDENVERKVA